MEDDELSLDAIYACQECGAGCFEEHARDCRHYTPIEEE